MNGAMEAGWGQIYNLEFLLVLVDAGIKSMLILAFAGLLCWGWRRASAATRHWIWFLAVASLVALPASPFLRLAWEKPVWTVSAGLVPGNQVRLAINMNPERDAHGATFSTAATEQRMPAAGISNGNASRWAARLNMGWLSVLPALWVVGLAMILAHGAVGWMQLRRIRQEAQSIRNDEWAKLLGELRGELGIFRSVDLLQSRHNLIPMTWGWLRPVVLVPMEAKDWPEDRRRMVLMHELAHVRRWDSLTQAVARLACALYWFNPLVWMAIRRMNVERERACDDLVLNSGCKASEYAGHLIEIAGQFRSMPRVAAIAMARPSALKERVTLILDDHRNRSRLAWTAAVLSTLAIGCFGLALGGCTTTRHASASWKDERSATGKQLKRFFAEKERQAVEGAKAEGKEMVPEYLAVFAAAKKGDWLTMSNNWERLRQRAPQYQGDGKKDERLFGTAWQTILETWGAYGNVAMGGDPLVELGNAIVESIPPGSIYFGGTDPGRCVITALQKSHVRGEPFFTLTQNALADASYLQYLRGMYGGSIYIPDNEESQRSFQEYLADAQRRMKENKLKPGEEVKQENGKVQVSGQVSVMEINGKLSKVIFDKNPGHEFFIEESFPLDWMYPHLSPSGLILKIHREPLPEISDEIVRRDRQRWIQAAEPLIGRWLEYDTAVAKVAAYAKTAHPKVPKADISLHPDAVLKWASKLRGSTAGVYAWRGMNTKNSDERRRMLQEADFAYRQAFALCPYSPEAVFRYVNLLVYQNRFEDAALISRTASQLAPENKQFQKLAEDIEQVRVTRKH